LPLVPVLSHMNPVYTLFKIHFNIILTSTPVSIWSSWQF
jgi:hypothetical protein